MNRKPPSNLAERRGYHHGHLREALIEAARRLIAERGPAGFTLSDAAKLAGVSPAAPYRHFKDRQALLAEVARLGFQRLGERLQAAATGGGKEGFFAMGRAYLAFAREEPAFYAAMFNTGTSEGLKPRDEDPGFGALRQAVGRVLGTDDAVQVQRAAVLVFALTHGLASLTAAGLLGPAAGVGEADAALEWGVDALMKGLPLVVAPASDARG